jgi:hypothetical protein
MKRLNNEAVSPVVGVMLMLVVTIIIAAVVSAFAGGLADDDAKARQAALEATPVIVAIEDTDGGTFGGQYPVGFEAANGIMFENKGGDAFSLNDIAIELENAGVTMIVTAADELPSTGDCLPTGTTDGGYFAKVGTDDTSDKTIAPGDKFMFYADNCYITDEDMYGNPIPPEYYLLWTFDTGYGYGSVNDFYKWSVIDQRSSKTICSGEFLLK